MKLWIDTEFNEFRGALISLALVDENGREFYEVLPCANPGNWVAANVMPILNKPAIDLPELQRRLQNWLMHYDAIEVIADWPEDIQHFCAVLITGPGLRINTPPLTMTVLRDLAGQSQLPHNALADAKANRLAHLTAQPAAPAVVESHERMRALLERLNRLGGLGFDAHDRISAVLAAAPTPPEGPQP